ncbi:MAG: E3 binding domain-containing protein, partial [Acidobacteriota bacterium]|nr:E3 binding domain-containing protein [Acidobacteriota bacterium]
MPTDVIMPQMGESIFEGTITKWLKKPGDVVQKDEPLFEISTDKVDAEIPAPAAGVLREIKVPEGATVQVNTVVAVLDESGTAAVKAASAKPEKPAAPPVAAKEASAPASVLKPAPAAGIPVVMPQMGESIFEGTITKWLKKAGDTVQKDEPLFEISTDKVDAEIPSPANGVLTAVLAAEGATVEVNTVVAVIGGSGQVAAGTTHAAPVAPAAAEATGPEHAPIHGARLRSSPLVRRIAKEHHVDLSQVRGTGSEGRITKEDILRFLSQPAAVPQTAAASAAPSVPAMTERVEPLSKMRAIIAQRMLESKRISPHVHSVYKVDMTRIARL